MNSSLLILVENWNENVQVFDSKAIPRRFVGDDHAARPCLQAKGLGS
jgi:hypothetical protein